MCLRPFALSLLLSIAFAAAHAATFESAIGISFPDEVAGLPFHDRHEFPQKALGVNIAYQRDDDLLRGSVYIYDAGLRSIPPGAGSPAVHEHFAQDHVVALARTPRRSAGFWKPQAWNRTASMKTRRWPRPTA